MMFSRRRLVLRLLDDLGRFRLNDRRRGLVRALAAVAPRRRAAAGEARAVDFYKAQLAEIDRDVARGLIAAERGGAALAPRRRAG